MTATKRWPKSYQSDKKLQIAAYRYDSSTDIGVVPVLVAA